jgi:hypothetical protein
MGIVSGLLRLVLFLAPLGLSVVSIVLNLPNPAAGRVLGATVLPGLIAFYATDFASGMATIGPRFTSDSPPNIMKLLGVVLILSSFVPWLVV